MGHRCPHRLPGGRDKSHLPFLQPELRGAVHRAGPAAAAASLAVSLSVVTGCLVTFVTTITTSLQRHLLPVGILGCKLQETDVAESRRERGYSKASVVQRILHRQEPGPGTPARNSAPSEATKWFGGTSTAVPGTRHCSLCPECCSHRWVMGLPHQPHSHCHPGARLCRCLPDLVQSLGSNDH